MRPSDRDARTVLALLVAACCVAALAFVTPAGAQSVAVPQADDQPAPDNTITRIDLAANGSATWEITLRTRLENDTDVSEYERFQERFRANESRYLDPFAERMSGVVAAANDSSDREMRALAFAAETDIQEVPRRWGVVRFRFTWTGFAATDGDAVVAGDVFDGGFFLGDGDALAVSAPDGYAVESADPDPADVDDGVVEWRGREDFDDGRPRVRAVPAADGSGGDAGSDDGTDGDGDGPAGTGDVTTFAALGILLVAAAGLGTYAVRTGRFGTGSGDPEDRGTPDGPSGGPSGTNGGASTDDPGATDPGASGSGAGVSSGPEPAAAAESDSDGASGGIDPDLLTDEDRVRRALRDRGGRMKQSAIVDEFGWSKSKTSRVLSRMADDGDVEKLRLGRENVIDLVEADDPVDAD